MSSPQATTTQASPPNADSPSKADQIDDTELEFEVGLDGASDPLPNGTSNNNESQPGSPSPLENGVLEAKEPTKKDVLLRDFVAKMDDYAPIVRSTTIRSIFGNIA